mgnify:CR=1 FL=1
MIIAIFGNVIFIVLENTAIIIKLYSTIITILEDLVSCFFFFFFISVAIILLPGCISFSVGSLNFSVTNRISCNFERSVDFCTSGSGLQCQS